MIYEQSNTPIDPGVLERVMSRLSHRGPDGKDVKVNGHVAMGHWHFWTTPEEVNEHQPLEVENLPFTIVLDGRLDNRVELITELGLHKIDSDGFSDAALMLHAYDRWEEKCFTHFIGDYAVVIQDLHREKLVCARDALGERTLFYSLNGSRMVIASEPWAVAAAGDAKIELNEKAVAYFFALQATEDGQTFFKDIFELLPAHVMVVSASGKSSQRYWESNPSNRIHRRNDVEYAEEYRTLLEESIHCRMRSINPIAVLMSGGLDSTSVVSLASRMVASKSLTTISYVFDELSECDERKYIEMMVKQCGIRSIQVSCDDAWPFKNWQEWPHTHNFPDGNPYRLVKDRVYDRAYDEGFRVLLDGMYGDELFSGYDNWLVDLISEGYWKKALYELRHHFTHMGFWSTINSSFFRRMGKHLIGFARSGQRKPSLTKKPIWITPYTSSTLASKEDWVSPHFDSKRELLGILTSRDSSSEYVTASHHSLELRHPYRDRRLVEYLLSLPSYLLYGFGFDKYVSRVAMQGFLPHEIVSRSQPTVFLSLFMRGIDRERESLSKFFTKNDSTWNQFVKSKWLTQNWQNEITPKSDGPASIIPWLCVSFDTWFNNKFC